MICENEIYKGKFEDWKFKNNQSELSLVFHNIFVKPQHKSL